MTAVSRIQFLVDHARRRADDLDARRLRDLALHPHKGRVPSHRAGTRSAAERDRGVDRRGRAHPSSRPTSCSSSIASGFARRASEAEEIVERARQAAAANEREARTEGPGTARADARADAPRHRGRDPSRARRDPSRRRRPHGAGHRTGDAQGADRGGPATAGRGRDVRARLHGPERRTRAGNRDAPRGPASGRGRRGLRAGALRGRLRARRARRDSGAARPVCRRAVHQPQSPDLLLLARISRPTRRRTAWAG